MPKYLGALTIVLLLGMVLTRVFLLKRQGIKTMKFGSTDKTDFLIPPFALFYFYVLFAAAFDRPNVGARPFFHSEAVAWTGVLFCVAGLIILLWSLISFRQSFRIGIGTDHADKLIVDGVFAFSRNPTYVAFAVVLLGEFLIFHELDQPDLSRCGRGADAPSSVARGRLSEGALRRGLRTVLGSRQKVSLSKRLSDHRHR